MRVFQAPRVPSASSLALLIALGAAPRLASAVRADAAGAGEAQQNCMVTATISDYTSEETVLGESGTGTDGACRLAQPLPKDGVWISIPMGILRVSFGGDTAACQAAQEALSRCLPYVGGATLRNEAPLKVEHTGGLAWDGSAQDGTKPGRELQKPRLVEHTGGLARDGTAQDGTRPGRELQEPRLLDLEPGCVVTATLSDYTSKEEVLGPSGTGADGICGLEQPLPKEKVWGSTELGILEVNFGSDSEACQAAQQALSRCMPRVVSASLHTDAEAAL